MENRELITKAITYAKLNAATTDISVQDVAAGAGFSLDYFNRIFLAHTGFTVMSYINHTRLREAARLLRTTNYSILDIALEIGYDSHEGFIKAFKKQYHLTPSEYRIKKKTQLMSFGELKDPSIGTRFVHENPDFQLIDNEMIIDYLLEKDAKRYSYFCANIKYMGLEIAAPAGDYERGIIGIGDNRNGKSYLELMTDNTELLIDWLRRFSNIRTFRSVQAPEAMRNILNDYQINLSPQSILESLFLGMPLPCILPESIIIRPLTVKDIPAIRVWSCQTNDVNIHHLLNETYYSFDSSLDYGLFENDRLIAIAECGIDEVHGLKINDSCRIHFMTDKASDIMYKSFFSYITNDLLNRGSLPFDDIQYGEYAKSHGNFTAAGLGFEIMNWRYENVDNSAR